MLSRVSDFQWKNNSDRSGGSDLKKENSSLESDDIDSEKIRKFRKRVLKLLLEKTETVLILSKQIFEDKSEKVTRKMSKESELKFQVFGEKHYSIWKKRILLHLKWKKCDEPATRERFASDDTWVEKNLKAMNYIYCSITNEQLEFFGKEDTALKIMKKFDQMYIKESSACQICLRNRLDRLKLKDYENASSFFTDFERLINELKSAGGKVNEREKVDYMLKTLPDSYSYIGDSVNVLQESDRTCEFVKSKISMWEIKGQSGVNTKKVSAFKTEKKMTCFECGKPGHMKKDCWYKQNAFGYSGAEGGASRHGGARQLTQFRGRGGRDGRDTGRQQPTGGSVHHT